MMEKPKKPVRKALLAFIIGGVLGALIISSQYAWSVYETNGYHYLIEYGLRNTLGVLLISFIVWLIGIVICGSPILFMLHMGNWTTWMHAVVSGFLIPFFMIFAFNTKGFSGVRDGNSTYYASGGYIWLDGRLTEFGWKIELWNALSYGLYGAIIGLIIWFVVYYDPKKNAEDKLPRS
jgi:hypothetical protein